MYSWRSWRQTTMSHGSFIPSMWMSSLSGLSVSAVYVLMMEDSWHTTYSALSNWVTPITQPTIHTTQHNGQMIIFTQKLRSVCSHYTYQLTICTQRRVLWCARVTCWLVSVQSMYLVNRQHQLNNNKTIEWSTVTGFKLAINRIVKCKFYDR